MVDSTGYAAIAKQLGVDVVIPKKTVVVDTILSKLIGVAGFAGGRGIKGIYSLGESNVGILEVEIISG
jgi:trk system potassium uptake protein TrkA